MPSSNDPESNVGERFAAPTNESFLRSKRAKRRESRTQLSALLKASSPGRQNGFDLETKFFIVSRYLRKIGISGMFKPRARPDSPLEDDL